MKAKLRCKFCGGEHSATQKHFPIVLYGQQEVFKGKGKNKKSLGIKSVVVGYVCFKCVGKHKRSEFIKEHSIKPAPGQRMTDAIKNKIRDLKMMPEHPTKRIKPKSGFKVKDWIKKKFFKGKII